MRLVVALGGNALLRRGQPLNAKSQAANIAVAARALAQLANAGHHLTLTHGNGPQIGLLALESGQLGMAQSPLDVLDAETEGWIGYQLELELAKVLPEAEIATLLTRIRVDTADPAFFKPTKPVGPVYSEAEARRQAAVFGWHIAPDGAAWRRVVASPEPREILNLAAIRRLRDAGVITICAGGGGIPVTGQGETMRGVEAVIDKDLASALLATELAAEFLLILTDVDGVYRDFGGSAACRINRISPAEAEAMDFAAGSMGPKIRAACRFARATGRPAAIGRLRDAVDIVNGAAGTWIA